jgi:hypothetical protein
MRTMISVAAVWCCLIGPVWSDTDTSKAVTTPEQARLIALAYTGFDSTARTESVLKRFRLAVRPMSDSSGRENIKESNLWLVTFYGLDVVVPGVRQDYKVFIDSASGYLVELYSVPPDSAVPRQYEVPFADESRVADITTLRPASPPPVSFAQALQRTVNLMFAQSHQVFATCELVPHYDKTSAGPFAIWLIWGSGVMHCFGGPCPENGKLVTQRCTVKADTGALVELATGAGLPPYLQQK